MNTDILAGQVDITLAGETMTLRPTLDAVLKVNRFFGGMIPARDRVLALDIEAVAAVIAFGSDSKPDLEKVWKDLADLVGPVSEFLLVLRNGGKPIADITGAQKDPQPGKAEA